MTIHHDKLLYGKLASLQSDISDADLRAMAEALENCGYTEETETERKKDSAVDSAGAAEKDFRGNGCVRNANNDGKAKNKRKSD